MRARKDRETRAHLPQGTLVAIAGGKEVQRRRRHLRGASTRPRRSTTTSCSCHGGGPGVERIAAQWAERNGVHQVVCKPDWERTRPRRPVPAQRRAAQPPAEGRASRSPAAASPTTSSTRPVKLGIPVARSHRLSRSAYSADRVGSPARSALFFVGAADATARPAFASPGACGAGLRGGSAALPSHRIAQPPLRVGTSERIALRRPRAVLVSSPMCGTAADRPCR